MAPAGAGRTVRTKLASLSSGGPGTGVRTAARPEGWFVFFPSSYVPPHQHAPLVINIGVGN